MKTFFETVSRCHFVAGSGLAFSPRQPDKHTDKREIGDNLCNQTQKHMRTRSHAGTHLHIHTDSMEPGLLWAQLKERLKILEVWQFDP